MFVIIVNQILKMLLLLLLGCLCFRMRLIDENGSKVLANMLLMVVNPMLAIVSLQTEYSAHLAQGLLVAYLLAFLTHLVAAILSTVLIRTTGNPDCGIDRFASMYSNCGFIGIPLVQSILGNEGVLYLTAYMTVFNFFSWTHGIMIMTGTFSLKELKKGLLSPMIFASILGVVFFFGSALLYAAVAYTGGNFTRPLGIAMLAVFAAYMILTVRQMKSSPAPAAEEPEAAEAAGSTLKDVALLVVGAVLIAIGADLLVENGTLIAQALGVPESVIALTFVALGTSLPELVTAITSLAKGHGSLSLGNVIGANLFNLVLVSGVSVTLSPFSIPQNATIGGINASLVVDVPVMLGVMALLCVPALLRGKLSRWQGVTLLAVYAAFCLFQFFVLPGLT